MAFSLVLCVLPLAALILWCVVFVKGCSPLYALGAALAGALALVPIAAVQLFAAPLFQGLDFRLATRLARALILNGLIEETVKFLCILCLPVRGRSLRAVTAGGAIAGLTVGSLEAVMYFAGGAGGILPRLATAALIHTLCAVLSALCIRSFRDGKKHWAPFALAVVIHGVYNFFAGFSGGFRWFSLAAILFGAIECRVWYQKAE
ncbi:MAG: PrsW family intramembrane metalloprotease [Spirochaetaceae bacterium]|jgi:RsiW-degrading membrane proteinase PrsW (M82 family)|nr:PrsW family intramembrane metalloprotease [Spirochaetaceae bacterium]